MTKEPDMNALRVIEEFNDSLNETIITITHKDNQILSFSIGHAFISSEMRLLLDQLPSIYRLGVVDGVKALHNAVIRQDGFGDSKGY